MYLVVTWRSHESRSVSLGLLTLSTDRAMVLHQEVAVLLVGSSAEDSLGPEIRSQVGVGLGNSSVGCLGCGQN